MFVDDSKEEDWKQANEQMIQFMRKVTGVKDLSEELIELDGENGGLNTVLPITQKKAVDKWKE